jgi:acyl carrier protein
MTMMTCNTETVIEVLWESLGSEGQTDLTTLKKCVRDGAEINDLGLDSLDMVDYYLRLQDRFDVQIPEDAFDQLTSFSAIAAFIQRRMEPDS